MLKSIEEDSQNLFGKCCKRKRSFKRDRTLSLIMSSWLIATIIINLFFLLIRFTTLGFTIAGSCLILANFLALLTFFVIFFKSPGYLKRTDASLSPTWTETMEKVNFTLLCPECKIIKVPRSHHCYLCGNCVSVFDHHCEWLNQCIGGHNNVCFLYFIICMNLNIITTIIVEIFLIYEACTI